MQKLGKADETRDAAFEEMVSNFNKQMVRNVFKSFLNQYLINTTDQSIWSCVVSVRLKAPNCRRT